jgi:tetratricopeptide (TPR) repeat protein
MRRWILTTILCLLFSASAAFAQDAASSPPPPTLTVDQALQTIQSAAAESQARLDAINEQAANADRMFNLASNLLGIFEAIGFVAAVLGVALGAVGVTRLLAATNELNKARERFDKEIKDKAAELVELRSQLEASISASAQHQQVTTERATLALSLLPLGEKQYKAQDFQGAMDTYRRALELDDGNPVTHLRLGYVCTQSGLLDEARQHLQRALEIEPGFAAALAALGYVYRRIAEKMTEGIEREELLNQAEGRLLEALRRSPKLVDDDGESWWGSLGGLYRRRSQVQDAIRAYERAGEVTPHSSYPFSNLALLYMQTDNRERMLATYRRVERLARAEAQAEVENYWAYADLLVSQLALGKVKEAEGTLLVVKDIAPADSPYVLELLVETLQRLQNALGGDDAAGHINGFIDRLR